MENIDLPQLINLRRKLDDIIDKLQPRPQTVEEIFQFVEKHKQMKDLFVKS